jgi:hypothetical protein
LGIATIHPPANPLLARSKLLAGAQVPNPAVLRLAVDIGCRCEDPQPLGLDASGQLDKGL